MKNVTKYEKISYFKRASSSFCKVNPWLRDSKRKSWSCWFNFAGVILCDDVLMIGVSISREGINILFYHEFSVRIQENPLADFILVRILFFIWFLYTKRDISRPILKIWFQGIMRFCITALCYESVILLSNFDFL